jgi:hypothetical protein
MKPGFATAISLAVALALVAAGGFAQSAPVANSRVTPSLVQNSTDAGWTNASRGIGDCAPRNGRAIGN